LNEKRAAFGRSRDKMMNLHNTPKLYPPMALLWNGPMPYQKVGARSGTPAPGSALSVDELRSIVSAMVD